MKPWPKMRLGAVVTAVSRDEAVDPVKEYRLLGVRLDGQGPFLRETVLGSQSAANKLYRVASGDFIYSRLFACRGAFGIIEPGLDGCYVSGEFPTFRPVEGKLDLRFLRYWFRLFDTLGRVNEDCTGSTPLTRNRFKEQFFLVLEIPLPPLQEQRRIVARIEELAARIHEARSLRHQAIGEAEALLLSVLFGIFRARQPQVCLGDALELHRGFDLPAHQRIPGPYPVFAANGKVGDHVECRVKGPGVCTGRSGSVGAVNYVEKDFWPLNTALYVSEFRGNHPRLVYYMLLSVASELRRVGAHTAVPTLDRKRAHSQVRVHIPQSSDQRMIVTYLDNLQPKLDALKRLQAETAAELDALLPSILDRAFKGEL